MTKHLEPVWKVWEELCEDDSLLEDRREYEQDQLARMYDLDEEQAEYLYRLIKYEFDPDYKDLYGLLDSRGLYPANWAVNNPNYQPTDEEKEHDKKRVEHAVRKADALCENIIEFLHMGMDGWEDGDKVVIQQFLMDLGIAVNITYKDKCRADGVEPQP